jgi:hypothetical protein
MIPTKWNRPRNPPTSISLPSRIDRECHQLTCLATTECQMCPWTLSRPWPTRAMSSDSKARSMRCHLSRACHRTHLTSLRFTPYMRRYPKLIMHVGGSLKLKHTSSHKNGHLGFEVLQPHTRLAAHQISVFHRTSRVSHCTLFLSPITTTFMAYTANKSLRVTTSSTCERHY